MSTKYKVEKFNRNNFLLYKLEMKAILKKDNCVYAIEEKLVDITDQRWKEINDNDITNLHLAMPNAILSSIVEMTTVN